jgi:uncharacterized membrane protein
MAEERKVTFGLTEKAAFILLYLFSWLSALIFFVSEKEDKRIRLHALQWLIFSAAFCIAMIILGWIFGAITAATILSGGFGGIFIFGLISWLLWIGYIVIMILGIVRAFNGSIIKIPVAYDMAEKKA